MRLFLILSFPVWLLHTCLVLVAYLLYVVVLVAPNMLYRLAFEDDSDMPQWYIPRWSYPEHSGWWPKLLRRSRCTQPPQR